MSPFKQPIACVLGDMDLVRPLGLAGIKCAVAVPPGAASRYSRFTVQSLEWADPWQQPENLVNALIKFGKERIDRPVLFFQSDGDLLAVSRNREQLENFFRFAIADQELVEDLVNKERFQALAERLKLPVPPAQRLHPESDLRDLKLNFPIIVKPLIRRPELWKSVVNCGKATRIDTPEELRLAWPKLKTSGVELLAQELIPGPETSIESYHVYVGSQGEILGEFTGKKVRTYPLEYGDSSALVTTEADDVAMLGRELVRQLGLCGVAKFDFKRAPDGRLYLLEVNPRFNLWHHLGALAGVNIPALVFQNLTSETKLTLTTARSGLTWCRAWQDVLAARQSNVNIFSWFRWAMSCEAKRLMSWDDPMPIIGGASWRVMVLMKKALLALKPRTASGHGSTAEPRAVLVSTHEPSNT